MKTYTKFKEYIWLVNTIYHAKAISLADINRKWLLTDMSDGIEMARNIHSNEEAMACNSSSLDITPDDLSMNDTVDVEWELEAI